MVLKLLKNTFKIIDKIMDWLANLIIFVVFCFGSSQLLIGYFDEKKEEIKYITDPFTGTKFNILHIYVPCATILTLATEKFLNLILPSA